MKLPNEIIHLSIPYRPVSLHFNMTFGGLLEGNPLDAFRNLYLPRIRGWHDRPGNFVENLEKLEAITSSADLPPYYCEIVMEDSEFNWLNIRYYTHLTLDKFLLQLNDPLQNMNIDEIFKSNCEEFNP